MFLFVLWPPGCLPVGIMERSYQQDDEEGGEEGGALLVGGGVKGEWVKQDYRSGGSLSFLFFLPMGALTCRDQRQ